MKKLFIILISLITITGAMVYSKNDVFADGIELEHESSSTKINITYIVYSIKDENGDIVKSIKQGQYVISEKDNYLTPIEDNAYLEQDNDIDRTKSDYLNNTDTYKIHPINQPNKKEQKPNRKRPRPIMPLIATDIFSMYYI